MDYIGRHLPGCGPGRGFGGGPISGSADGTRQLLEVAERQQNETKIRTPNQTIATTLCGLLAVGALVSGCATTAPLVSSESSPAQEAEKPAEDAQAAIANQVPDTDVLVFELDASQAAINLRFLRNATARAGYDNQPNYIPGTRDFMFASIVDGVQSDVYIYQEESNTIRQVTDTPLSEYSPTPLADGGFSSVTVETDGTQRLWRYSPLGHAINPIRADVTGVGYHAWLGQDQLAAFLVTEPLTLEVLSTASPQRTQLTINPGRSLHRIPNQDALSYVQMNENAAAQLMRWDQNTAQTSRLVVMPEGVQDMTWLPDGRALLVAGTELLVWEPGTNSWQARFELAEYVTGPVTRIAVNDKADRLALVVSQDAAGQN